MPRQKRYRVPGYPQHVVQRGNNRQACFFEDRDYRFYRECMAEAAAEFKVDIHAYVLMANHVHLLLTPHEEESISLFMQSLGRKYVKRANRGDERTGAAWEGRYHASLVEEEQYLLACYRYIELNPVRAGIVPDPGDYPWSSYHSHAWGGDDGLITDHPIYEAMGDTRILRQIAYGKLFEEPFDNRMVEGFREGIRGSWAVGSDTFRQAMEKQPGLSLRRGPKGGVRPGAGRRKSVVSDPAD